MSQTNIGPCECCGQPGCACSNCNWEWQYSETLLVNVWVVISPCGGGDGSNERCCACPPPPRPGDYLGEQYVMTCTGSDRCTCCQCSATWDAFTETWVEASSCVDPNGNGCGSCLCVLPSEPGTTHGQNSGLIACGCQS